MEHYKKKYTQTVSRLLGLALAISLVLPLCAKAAPLDLATIPLANSPTVTIQPNLLFVLDDSGSMGWNYMPDWAGSSDQSLFRNASYNTMAYNPAIRYQPPAFFDAGGLNTTQYPSQTGMATATGADSSAKPNWINVKNNAYSGSSTTNLTASSLYSGSARFYTIVPGEFCTKKDLRDCATQTAPSTTYPYPAPVRWCNSSANAIAASPAASVCQATRLTGFTNLRAPQQNKATFNITGASSTPKVNGITVNGLQIMSAASSGGTNTTSAIAQEIVDSINNCTYNLTGNCTVAGYSATRSSSTITISAPAAITFTPALSPAVSNGTLTTGTIGAFAGGTVPGVKLFTPIISSVVSYPYPGSATKASSRTDCGGATCTYNEEMTNYANWWTYYQTRMQTMKTSASLAFKDIGVDFRVGFMTIHPIASNSLKFDTFNTAQKAAWYNKFFSISAGSATPLRSAISKAGRIYANKETIGGAFTDPVEYACQQNFTLLTTDGMWNTDALSDIKEVNGAQVGNRDNSPTLPPMYEGSTASLNSLADVAKYYNDTDLRTTALGNCTGALGGSGGSVCEDPPPSTSNQKQNMVTLTLGLGVDGTLAYTSDYKVAAGDYADIKAGTKNWPVPAADSPQAIDDLWHAAVNGGGTYFSAKSPAELVSSLKEALASIKVKVGAGTAAATSTINPVAGDSNAYVASYTTGHWIGNLEKRSMDIVTGAVQAAALNCVEDVVTATFCTAPSSIVANGGGYDCVTPGATAATCLSPGVLDVTDCKVSVPVACTGHLKDKVFAFTDTRTIKMNKSGALVDFSYSNLSAAQQATFNSAWLAANLTQWISLTPAQVANATGDNLANYLRGRTGYDENSGDPDKKVFRKRHATLGDAIDSKPAFIGKPTFSYTDPGYAAFKTLQAGRAKTVYMGANDGMLHAFDADTLEERWAYVPTMVIPNMWKLADTAYANKHNYYADGEPVISDICVSPCSSASDWRTILVAGLNGGGRGYYALDITNPTSPLLLWEVDASASKLPNLGYTFGSPVITKRPDGTWVVLVTSGYNNIPDNSAFYALPSTKFKPNNPALYLNGDGVGYLYVLDAVSGNKLTQISTGVGGTSTPSGLAKIKGYTDDAEKNNTTTYVYGGDLLGNLWRFNLTDNSQMKLAELKVGGISQPITTPPELGLINNKRVVLVGTGKYLEVGDLIDTSQQTFYAIKDNNATVANPHSTLVPQTIVPFGTDSRKSGTNNAVDFNTGLGWYVDFPDSGERQNVASRLVLGTMMVPTTVPTSSACQPAGYGWFNYLDYKTGLAVTPSAGVVSSRTSSPTVGFNVVYINGKPKVSVVAADDPTPKLIPDIPFSGSGTGFQKRRSIWRELVN